MLFNLLTGVVALALLPWLVAAIGVAREMLGHAASPAAELALFHTVFNLLGVALMWPLGTALAAFLDRRFRTAEEDEARLRHLDRTVLAVPALALDALEREVRRMGAIAVRMARAAVAGLAGPQPSLQPDRRIVAVLDQAVGEFVSTLSRSGMSQDNARRLSRILRIERYYETAAEMALEIAAAAAERPTGAAAVLETGEAFRVGGLRLLEAVDPGREAAAPADHEVALVALEDQYQALKTRLLELGAVGELRVGDMEARLRAYSAARRAIEQCVKAARALALPGGVVPSRLRP